MTKLFGEWPDAQRYAPWVWVPLLILVAAPFPYGSMPLPERGVPLMWLLAAGGLALFGLITRVSWPFAALLAWGLGRVFLTGIWIEGPASLQAGVIVMDAGRARPLQVLLGLALVSLLYLAAREMTPKAAKVAAWALVAGVAYEFVFGYLNLWKVYPFMAFVLPDHMGRSMGFLTHPNFYGSFMALGLPVACEQPPAPAPRAVPRPAVFVLVHVHRAPARGAGRVVPGRAHRRRLEGEEQVEGGSGAH